ncbi:hypothetical protein [uncultured Muribaculum sp.]|uniref:hypothetical protein n=1 Tax=uncultured Muribaculum sp. TaxID=1918613 RepID=UPI0025EC40CC|nr:hypothetical protein [uncultured Muribaculum sp.]
MDKFFRLVFTVIFIVIFGIIDIQLRFVGFMYVSVRACPELHGSYNLGHNVYMLENDGHGRFIVLGGRNMDGRVCLTGDNLVPEMSQWYDSLGRRAEYVVDARFDDRHIIARTDNYQTHIRKYYIITKDFPAEMNDADEIIRHHILSFTDSAEFIVRCEKDSIALHFKNCDMGK